MTIPAMEMILPQGSTGNIPAFLAKLLAPQSTKFHRVSKANTRIKTKTGLNKHLARPIWIQVNFDSESSDISCFKKNIVLDCQKRSFIWN